MKRSTPVPRSRSRKRSATTPRDLEDSPARVVGRPRGVPPAGYGAFLTDLKERIRQAQVRSALALNRDLINLYLAIGQRILLHQERQGWGQAVVERLSIDLRREFPEMRGFSPRNLWDMRRLFESIRRRRVLRQLVAEIPWGHNLVLLNKVKDVEERLWYLQQTIQNGWSRNILVLQVENQLYHRAGQAPTNFIRTLPEPQSELAQQALKDPYIFDFLTPGSTLRTRSSSMGSCISTARIVTRRWTGARRSKETRRSSSPGSHDTGR